MSATLSSSPGSVTLDQGASPLRARIAGDWTLAHYAALRREVQRLRARIDERSQIELSGLGALDTAGAGLLVELLGPERIAAIEAWAPQLPAERLALLRTVATALDQPDAAEPPRGYAFGDVLAHIGGAVTALWKQQRALLGFIGLTLQTLLLTLPRPRRWRLTSLAVHIEQTGLDAVPIVALLTFLVGAVVAFLGATVLADFGGDTGNVLV